MKHFEQRALTFAAKNPTHWYRYVDDTFVAWLHGKEELQNFLQHPNSIHPNIKFMMEMEHDKSLPFLDVRVSRKPEGSLGFTVYRKLKDTDLYLHAKFEPPSTDL
jgi:hypothetical protein